MEPRGFQYIAGKSINGGNSRENSLPLLLKLKLYVLHDPAISLLGMYLGACPPREVYKKKIRASFITAPN